MISRNFGSVNLFMCVFIIYVMSFIMVTTRGGAGGSGYRSGSGTGTRPIDEGLHEFIALEIMQGILDATPMMLGTIKEGIIEMTEECFRIFRA